MELYFLHLSLGDYKRVCLCLSGCGGYADNKVGAVSTTGHGEAIMKVTLARLILFHMEQGNTHRVHSHTRSSSSGIRLGHCWTPLVQVSRLKLPAIWAWPTCSPGFRGWAAWSRWTPQAAGPLASPASRWRGPQPRGTRYTGACGRGNTSPRTSARPADTDKHCQCSSFSSAPLTSNDEMHCACPSSFTHQLQYKLMT